jgi:transcriptional regulator with XRE-family HTH domain
LALRAGSTQAAISRVERGKLSPTIETIDRLLAVMGEEAEILVRRTPLECDASRLYTLRARAPDDRLAQAITWNRLAGQVSLAGERARTKAS